MNLEESNTRPDRITCCACAQKEDINNSANNRLPIRNQNFKFHRTAILDNAICQLSICQFPSKAPKELAKYHYTDLIANDKMKILFPVFLIQLN